MDTIVQTFAIHGQIDLSPLLPTLETEISQHQAELDCSFYSQSLFQNGSQVLRVTVICHRGDWLALKDFLNSPWKSKDFVQSWLENKTSCGDSLQQQGPLTGWSDRSYVELGSLSAGRAWRTDNLSAHLIVCAGSSSSQRTTSSPPPPVPAESTKRML